jgi:putative transposase
MSRIEDCWDNAAMVSFLGTLKYEPVQRVKYKTRQSARQDIFQWLETWYNRQRRQSLLGGESPDERSSATCHNNCKSKFYEALVASRFYVNL